jgi:hypothetical protein
MREEAAMGVFDFLLVDAEDKAKAAKPGAAPPPTRHKAPILKVVLDTTEAGSTVSWGEDGLDMRGIKQRFAANAKTGGTILEGAQFVGSFSALVTAQTPELLSLKFTHTDGALRKRLAAGGAKKPAR